MTFLDWCRSHVLLGFIVARLSDGRFTLAALDLAIGVLLILAMRLFDRALQNH